MGINNVSHATTRRGFLRVGGAGAIGALAGCLKGFGGSEGGGGLKIGFYGPFSGPASNIGQQKKMAANLARELINENDGVHGEDITLVFGDSESEPSAGRNEVNRLIQEENVDAVGGDFTVTLR
ncbi:ABC transporter substrate-binding protein [Haladaptatus pallidirubidus]|uniref:ABC transporter substrate-binding protein n=1 Tax=Haladaptatus pallidirubidus TaxID=1008152 RepID=UPI0035E6DC7A